MERTFALDMRPRQAQGCHRSEIQEEALPEGWAELESKEVFLEVVSRRPTVCQDPLCVRQEGVTGPSGTLKGLADQTCKTEVRNETGVELPGTFEGFVSFQSSKSLGHQEN